MVLLGLNPDTKTLLCHVGVYLLRSMTDWAITSSNRGLRPAGFPRLEEGEENNMPEEG